MRNFKSLIPALLTAFIFAGCNTDDLRNDIDELKNRVESLEAQVSAINENMNALQKLVEGKKTIQEYNYNEETKTWTLVLSDGTTLQLYQGENGVANTPTITVSEDNKWVINGTPTDVSASGADAVVPVFSVDGEGYWMVDYDGDGGEAPVRVKDVNGNDVLAKAAGGETGGDTFFESVKINGDFLEVKLAETGETYSLPIVPDLLCKINVEGVNGYKNKVLTVGYGLEATIPVKIKGENYFVTAPSGWVAQLSELSGEDATITLKAPVETSTTVGTRATADNTTDLTLQVNKGAYWAVEKIKVEAKKIIDSYKALYDSGESFNIGGIEITKEKFGEATEVSEDTEISKFDSKVYFVKPGVTLTFKNSEHNASANSLIIIGDNSNNNTAKFKLSNRVQLNMGTTPTDNSGYYVFSNIIFDTTGNSEMALIAYRGEDGLQDKAIVFDKCNILLGSKNFFELTNDGRYFKSLSFNDCKIKLSAAMNLVHINANTSSNFGTLSLVNNVLYADKTIDGNGFKLFNCNNATAKLDKLVINNNTFVNICSNWSGMYYTAQLGSIDLQNNLFWASELPANCMIVRPGGQLTGDVCKNNVGFSLNTNTNSWMAMYDFDKNKFDGAENITNIKAETVDSETNPFYGGTFNIASAEFVPNATYTDYGAKFE